MTWADEAPDEVVVPFSGELDLAVAPAVRSRLLDVLAEGRSRIVIDLRDVTFMDSTCLGVMIGALKRARAVGGDIQVHNVAPNVMRTFVLTGVDTALSVKPLPE
ncbi:MAG TPA: STAS domain-containing protein [Acidimicrobiales bacterium]|nr:STAS domain-containing protein [Acidimicrobiales bacterium]